MTKYEIIGCSRRREYTSKHTGEKQGCYNLHLAYESRNVEGFAVREAFVTEDKLNGYVPRVGDHVKLGFEIGWGNNPYLSEVIPCD